MQEHLGVLWDQASRGAKALVWLIQQLRRSGTAVVVAMLQNQWAVTDGIQAGHGFLPDVLGYSRLGSTHGMVPVHGHGRHTVQTGLGPRLETLAHV